MHIDKPLYTIANRSGEIVPIHYFGGWGSRGAVEIGVIDERAVRAFTRGQCHALALALHEKKGWDLYGLFSKYNFENFPIDIEDGLITPSHVIVRSDKGEYIDIMGIGADCRWSHRAELVPVQKGHVLQYEDIDYLEPEMEVANKFVEPVLGLVHEQRRSNQYSCIPM